MYIKDIFEQLTFGELSNLALGGGDNGAVKVADYPKVLAHINLGLLNLYTRFHLKNGYTTIKLVPQVYQYHLSQKYATSNFNSSELVRYIDDSEFKFKDDVVKVRHLVTDTGTDLPLNRFDHPYSAHLLSSLLVQLPEDLVNQVSELPLEYATENIGIHYQAKHPSIAIPSNSSDLLSVQLELPDNYMEALLYFIASRVNNPVGMSNEFHAGNSYWAKYEAACQVLSGKGMENVQTDENLRFDRNGWV